MIAIPNMEKPKNCAECFRILKCKAVPRWVTADDSIPKGCPLIEIVRCGECKWCDNKGKGRALICTNPYIDMDIHPLDFCSYGERRTDGNKRRSV